MRTLTLNFLLVLATLFAASCDKGADAEPADFIFIDRADLNSLDLNQMSYMQDFRITYAFREGLFGLKPDTFEATPAGCERFKVSPDKRTYTFYLRKSCRWSNGDAVTAHDYVFSWLTMLRNPGSYAYLFYYINGAEAYQTAYLAAKTPSDAPDPAIFAATAVDDYTLRVALVNPTPYLLDLLAFPPFYPRNERSMVPFLNTDPATGRATYDEKYTRPPAVVCNGPFNVTTWEFKRRLRLTKSDTYWDKGSVKLNSIELQINESALSQFLQYEAKAVDWLAECPADIAPELYAQKRPDFHRVTAFGTALLNLYCPQKFAPSVNGGAKNPLSDVRVRQALTMSVDKQFLVDQITRLGEQPATHYFPPGTLPDFEVLPGLPYDVPRAQELLAEAGYPNGNGFPRLPILFASSNSKRAKVVQAVKQQWKVALGIDIDIEGVEGKTFSQRMDDREFAIAPTGWYGDYADVSTFTDKYLSTSVNNNSAWLVPEYDALCAAAAREPDPAKRLTLLQKAEQMIDTQMPIIPLYHETNASMYRSNVHGVEANPRNLVIWKNVYVDR